MQKGTKVLTNIGFEVIRFTNEEVKEHPYKTKDKIKAKLAEIAESENNSPLHEVEQGPGVRETNTMPGYAGSSWYFLRYMDPQNEKEFCDRKISDYWNQVDLYIGGTEHAVGHLLYSRMWTKVLYDLGHIGFEEPFKRLVNQGMIQGSSRFVYRSEIKGYYKKDNGLLEKMGTINSIFVSSGIIEKHKSGEIDNDVFTKLFYKKIQEIHNHSLFIIDKISISDLHVDVKIVDGFELNIIEFRKWPNGEYSNAEFIFEDGKLEDGKYICGSEVEKMSKSKYNTVNPDDLVYKYGADTFRMYEMFLGPVEMSKPWDTKGIEGVHRFLKKFWRLFYAPTETHANINKDTKAPPPEGFGEAWIVTNDEPTPAELKVLHQTIKKIENDTERFSFNTAISGFMIATNELTDLDCHKRKILEPLLILMAPYAPHITAELYDLLGSKTPSAFGEGVGGEASILDAAYPQFEAKYVAESSKEYPISINGKLRTTLNISLDAAETEVQQLVLDNEIVQKWLEGKTPKKIIFVKNKMVNVVV